MFAAGTPTDYFMCLGIFIPTHITVKTVDQGTVILLMRTC